MVIIYLFASLLGALTTVVVLSSYGWLVALACAPLGGSVVAAVVAVLIVAFSGENEEALSSRSRRGTKLLIHPHVRRRWDSRVGS